ncbi:MAG: GNAT family N-acetyltransferase [Pontiellaceae bacterium]|jgi:GNAT superfamily N-acetyltransferase|nr:GNAT family N-acetyltransferase [Pontiellaceae bacterium]
MKQQAVTTFYLEMLTPDELRFKECAEPAFWVRECEVKQFRYNRFLYSLVGNDWQWFDKLSWTDDDWQKYVEAENLRTWVGYMGGSLAGYYELQKQENGNVEIAYFGLAKPFIAKGLGGHLLSHAIRSAWEWGAERVWVHTCTLDHPHALENYQARGMKIYKEETANRLPVTD